MEQPHGNINPGSAGTPGLVLLGFGWLLQLSHVSRSDVTFFAGLLSTLLAGVYYIIQIKKSLKK